MAVVGDGYTTTSGDKEAWISSLQDYYPFGLAMEDRSSNLADYRYGFNGKERYPATEWGQTHYDYGFRVYNPGIGKFLSVDPLTKDYPELTPFQFASNTPIEAIDLDGLEKKVVVTDVETGNVYLNVSNEEFTTRTGVLFSLMSYMGWKKEQFDDFIENEYGADKIFLSESELFINVNDFTKIQSTTIRFETGAIQRFFRKGDQALIEYSSKVKSTGMRFYGEGSIGPFSAGFDIGTYSTTVDNVGLSGGVYFISTLDADAQIGGSILDWVPKLNTGAYLLLEQSESSDILSNSSYQETGFSAYRFFFKHNDKGTTKVGVNLLPEIKVSDNTNLNQSYKNKSSLLFKTETIDVN